MTVRITAAVLIASTLATVSCGRSAQEEKVAQNTAQVTVDGNSRTSHALTCRQVSWLLTVNISAAPARIKMVLDLEHGKPRPESVDIDNLDGFTGVAGGGVGRAEAGFAGDTYTVTGTAQGTNQNDVNHPRTADFRISAKC